MPRRPDLQDQIKCDACSLIFNHREWHLLGHEVREEEFAVARNTNPLAKRQT